MQTFKNFLSFIWPMLVGAIVGWLVVTVLLTNIAKADTLDCKTHRLYCKIIEFNPKIDRTFAMEISNKLHHKAKIAGIQPELALAILIHETGLRNMNTYKTITEVRESCTKTDCVKITSIINKAFDLSIAQININTAVHYEFNVERLYKGDLDYALDCFFIILIDKMRLCNSLGKTPAYSCYHSVTDGYRMIYVDLVNRFL